MPITAKVQRTLIPAAIFLAVAVLLLILQGNRMVLDAIDEGILLEPAQRIAAGAVPYKDFFIHMGPGSYWIQALVFKLFGISIQAARIPVILDLALQCALVFWLAAKLSTRATATLATILFTCFQTANTAALIGQHRWDSATLALIAICCILEASTPCYFAAGAALAAAAWCTPSLAVLILVTLVFTYRKGLIPFTAGVAATAAAGAILLATQGALLPFWDQMQWLRANYSSVNITPYGAVNGGLANVFEGAEGIAKLVILIMLTCIELPAILPITAAAVWGYLVFRKQQSSFLLVSMVALVATAYPRPDVGHLAFVSALPYVMTVVGISTLIPAGKGIPYGIVPLLLALAFASNTIGTWRGTEKIESPVGALRVDKAFVAPMQRLLSQVRPGNSLYVHPYMPVHYFISQAANPTKFSYLGPGMMTATEETKVLNDLKAKPPQWLLYQRLTEEGFLHVFPSAVGIDPHFRILEAWLEQNYQPLKDPLNLAGYELWQRKLTQ
ncbi:MAG: glycosyltransferase family 39 protein [Acidobacteria bacterium]|nr:glycosyltransferase family 39 protein [Acidobacteriota bacterium]